MLRTAEVGGPEEASVSGTGGEKVRGMGETAGDPRRAGAAVKEEELESAVSSGGSGGLVKGEEIEAEGLGRRSPATEG